MEEILQSFLLNKSAVGKCALCGKVAKLTFEHIPPRCANNNKKVRYIPIQNLLKGRQEYPWEISGLKYVSQQKGSGVYSLCASCNNDTGSWYGEEYGFFVQKAVACVYNANVELHHSVEFQKVYPLRFIKQVLSMFCSINPRADIDDLRRFVLDKDAVGLDKRRYKLCMFFVREGIQRMSGLTAIGDIFTGEVITISEITTFPLGFVLYLDSAEESQGIDITTLADHQYDEMCNIKMPLVFKETNNWLPYDYRTKEEIKKAIRMIEEEN